MNLGCAAKTAIASQLRVLGIATLAAFVYATAVHNATVSKAEASALFYSQINDKVSTMPCFLRTALIEK